jgi:hypothetical protein
MSERSSRNPIRHLRSSDIRGLTQLATQATTGVTGIAEGVHQAVLNGMGIPGGDTPGRARGITGLVYRSINGVTRLVGGGIDTLLASLLPLLGPDQANSPETPQRAAVLAALNGMMGDRLVASDSPFATPMSLRFQGEVLNWPDRPAMPEATDKVLLLVHGLCMNDLQWHAQHDGKVFDHGEALARALGYTPVYLRYNSGLHISQNARELATQLEQLLGHWPSPIREISVLAHSMGGLLIRGACQLAQEQAMAWPDRLANIVFLGTPHHGAPLEQGSNWLEFLLEGVPYAAPFARLGQLRSAGITDLRHGHVMDQDWQGRDRFELNPDSRLPVPLPAGVACYGVAATTAPKRGLLADRLIGDGLVPLRSALGQHDDPRRELEFGSDSQWIGYRMNHLDLLRSPRVNRQLLEWLSPG